MLKNTQMIKKYSLWSFSTNVNIDPSKRTCSRVMSRCWSICSPIASVHFYSFPFAKHALLATLGCVAIHSGRRGWMFGVSLVAASGWLTMLVHCLFIDFIPWFKRLTTFSHTTICSWKTFKASWAKLLFFITRPLYCKTRWMLRLWEWCNILLKTCARDLSRTFAALESEHCRVMHRFCIRDTKRESKVSTV